MTEIAITDQKTIESVQQIFSEHFPFLKLEFYQKEHASGEGSPDRLKIDVKKTIGQVRTKHNTGQLSIHGNQKVSTLEQAFQEVFGLNVQVFRKSGEQNETAKEFSAR